MMNKLIVPDVQPNPLDLESYNNRVKEICLSLEAKHPDWIRLDKDKLLEIVENSSAYENKTFIIPDHLVSSRRHMTKINRLVTYMMSTSRPHNRNFVLVGPSLDSLDWRIRYLIDQIEKYEEAV